MKFLNTFRSITASEEYRFYPNIIYKIKKSAFNDNLIQNGATVYLSKQDIRKTNFTYNF